MWACRKGDVELVDTLLRAGANVDTAGMVSIIKIINGVYCNIMTKQLM